jgi:hypothetical protein
MLIHSPLPAAMLPIICWEGMRDSRGLWLRPKKKRSKSLLTALPEYRQADTIKSIEIFSSTILTKMVKSIFAMEQMDSQLIMMTVPCSTTEKLSHGTY